jgi:molybdopterin synthase catalytic subunit
MNWKSPDMDDFPLIISVKDDEIDINALIQKVTLPTTGAVVSFTGVVRGRTEKAGRETSSLDYEAYSPMAETKMAQIACEIRERWPSVQGIAIVQRIGHFEPGAPTTVIVCSCAHRDDGAFEAARYGIDRLKQIVPVWKKENGPDGEEWIDGSYTPQAGE